MEQIGAKALVASSAHPVASSTTGRHAALGGDAGLRLAQRQWPQLPLQAVQHPCHPHPFSGDATVLLHCELIVLGCCQAVSIAGRAYTTRITFKNRANLGP